MTVYRDTNSTVTFEHPFAGPLDASVYRGGVKVLDVTGLPSVSLGPNKANLYSLDLTYRETQFDGRLDITWTGKESDGSVFSRTSSVDVVTPLATVRDLQPLFVNTNWTDQELVELEQTVRVFIQSYTRQTFGYEVGTLSVVGTGEKKIALPKRLINMTSVVGGPEGYFNVSNDGWNLYWDNENYLNIKQAPPEDFVDNTTVVSGVIYVPDSYWNQFRRGATYTITGEWGYYSVPDDVREAALILANDYASGDALYRDRYLKQMKAGDWMLVFDQGAYRGAGNVRVDQLLESYRRQGMVII